MKTENLTKAIHFPKLLPVPETPVVGFWAKLKRFLFFKRNWLTLQDYFLWSDILQAFIFIPAKFPFDGASVPKFLHSIMGPTGILLLGACPHDFGYRYMGFFLLSRPIISNDGSVERNVIFKRFTKGQLDSIFKDLCSKESYLDITPAMATFALTLFGFLGWNENRKIDNGVTRIEIDYPEYFKEE